MAAIANNLEVNFKELVQEAFNNNFVNFLISKETVKEFEKLSHDMSTELLVKLNKWLSEESKKIDPESEEPKFRIGLWIYYFKNENQGD